jgi:hypothetical protein
MNKAITAAVVVAAFTLGASQAIAADDTKMAPADKMTTDTGPGAGTPPGQPAGGETSDRTPDKTTTTPDSQTTTTDGETSDRTPDKDDATKK